MCARATALSDSLSLSLWRTRFLMVMGLVVEVMLLLLMPLLLPLLLLFWVGVFVGLRYRGPCFACTAVWISSYGDRVRQIM